VFKEDSAGIKGREIVKNRKTHLGPRKENYQQLSYIAFSPRSVPSQRKTRSWVKGGGGREESQGSNRRHWLSRIPFRGPVAEGKRILGSKDWRRCSNKKREKMKKSSEIGEHERYYREKKEAPDKKRGTKHNRA